MYRTHITAGTILRWLLIAAVVGAFALYVLWQSRIFITGPVITVTTAPPATTTAAYVDIGGTVANIVWITVNDRPIVTTPAGEFKERIVLEKGYTVIQLEAADRFGRTTTKHFSVVPLTHPTTTNQTD